ncbi:hypothetical protein MFRU_031g00910 [Monilinia fructicola]|nr:hypothetical protein MFRU_031g00910 [Monilinia fructicola]
MSTANANTNANATPTPTPPPRARPLIGVGVFLLHPCSTPQSPTFLMGPRLNSHGAGHWAHPGGHLEFGEELEECAAREVEEETGIVLSRGDVRFLTATNSVMGEKHYVTVWMVGRWDGRGEGPRNLEPGKCGGWEWVAWEEMRGWGVSEGKEGKEGRTLFRPVLDLLRCREEVLPPRFE